MYQGPVEAHHGCPIVDGVPFLLCCANASGGI
jgi:hypothetical protein